MSIFYRKERPDVFLSRFEKPSATLNAWSLKSHTIFTAKRTQKIVTVLINGTRTRVTCAVYSGTSIQLQGLSRPVIIAESEMEGLLASTSTTDVKVLVVKQLCKDHATSSSSSIFISGCLVDNFAASRTYPGHKLSIDLRTRKPFGNPFVSGLEKEYFLIGSVTDTQCSIIKYYGSTDEDLNEIVNFYGSRIGRPRE